MKRLINIVGSRQFAIWILLVTTVIIVLSNFIPKPYLMTQSEISELLNDNPFLYDMSYRFNVVEVTKSPLFIVVTIFLFVSISICTAKRSVSFAESLEKKESIPEISALKIKISNDCRADSLMSDKIRVMLKKKRWKIIEKKYDNEILLYGRKGVYGFLGSAIFHLGMLIVLIATLLSVFTRYNGSFLVTEDFGMSPPESLKGLTENERIMFPVQAMRMEAFQQVDRGPYPVDYRADLVYTNSYGNIRKKALRVNDPIFEGEYQFLLRRYGFAPRLVLKDEKGEVITDDAISLVILTPELIDNFELLRGIYDVKVRFFPDYYMDIETTEPRTRSKIPRNPVLSLKIEKDNKIISRALLPIGRDIAIEKYRLEFKDLYYWVQVDVSKDRGMFFILVAFFIIVSGLVVRILFSEKIIWIIVSETRISIGGRSNYFPAQFDEALTAIMDRINSI